MTNCSKCGKKIKFYQEQFTYVEINEDGARTIKCHLECINKYGLDLLDGTHMSDFIFDPNANIGDLDKDLAESLR